MEKPNVATTFFDDQSGVTYRVMAYRVVTMEEALPHLRMTLRRLKKKPRRGDLVEVLTIIGFND